MKKLKNEKTFRMTVLALFTALIILMSFTPLGYFRTAGLEITLLCIPVAAGAVLLGRRGGAFLGGVFGVTSFIQCLTGLSAFGAMLLSISWLGCAVTCIVPRILAGYAAGLVAELVAGKDAEAGGKREIASAGAASLTMPVLNTILFMGSLVLFFWKSEYIQGFAGGKSVLPFIIAFVGINGVIEAVSCFVIGAAVGKALVSAQRRITK